MLRSVLFRASALTVVALFTGAPAMVSAGETDLFGLSADLVAKDVPFRRLARVSGEGPYAYVNAFSDTVSLSPATASYTGPVFYGGYAFTSSSLEGGLTRQQIRNDRSLHGSVSDAIALQAFRPGGWADSVLTLHGALVFKLAPADQVPGASLDAVSLVWSGSGNTEPGRAPFDLAGRIIVQKDGVYHVSDTVFPLAVMRGVFALDGAALRTARWAPYDPAARLDFSPPPDGFATLDLSGVTAVGVYFENKGWLGSATANAAFTLELVRFGVVTRDVRSTLVTRPLLPAPPPAG